MEKHACNVGTKRSGISHAAFRVHSAIHQHHRALDSRPPDHVLWFRDLVLGLDLQPRTAAALVLAAAAGYTPLLAPGLQSVDDPELSYLYEMMHEQINRCTDHTCTDENCV